MLTVASVTFADGGDNVGVCLPVFTIANADGGTSCCLSCSSLSGCRS
jgi:cadmium resistance protein CadD (predicted permease)